MTVEAPATDFIGTDDVFDEEDPVAESQRQFVKQLNVFQQVVVRSSRVRILVIVTVDQQFDDWLRSAGIYQGLQPRMIQNIKGVN